EECRSPSGPSRSSAVSSVTCASSIQHRAWAQPGLPQASTERRSRTSPAGSTAICQASFDAGDRRLLPLSQLPAGGGDELVAGLGGELIQVRDQRVAGPGPVTGNLGSA